LIQILNALLFHQSGIFIMKQEIQPKEPIFDDEAIIELIIEEIAPNGVKKFPDDFLLDENCAEFFEVDLPATQLHLAPL